MTRITMNRTDWLMIAPSIERSISFPTFAKISREVRESGLAYVPIDFEPEVADKIIAGLKISDISFSSTLI